jgi:hypothetical protein
VEPSEPNLGLTSCVLISISQNSPGRGFYIVVHGTIWRAGGGDSFCYNKLLFSISTAVYKSRLVTHATEHSRIYSHPPSITTAIG